MRDFNHTVGVLVKAYLNNTLQKCNCYACAVGNMVADANGYSYRLNGQIAEWTNGKLPLWFDSVVCGTITKFRPTYELAKEQAESTGYTYEEVAQIEVAFENPEHCDPPYKSDDYVFDGLMAVVDVLADIHGIDLQSKEEAKALFVKH